MSPLPAPTPSHWRRRTGAAIAAAVCAGGLVWASTCGAQGPGAAKPPVKAAPEQGSRWAELKPAQQAALKPLEQEWSGMDGRNKQKWLALSAGFPKLTQDEQARVQARMSEWAKLTPRERGEARLHFQEAKQVPPADREARWKAYQALSPEQRQQLAARAVASTKPPARPAAVQVKSNIVPNPEYSAPPRAIAPTVVQAGPGATTTLITKRPSPPGHQQTGMPKIAATPEFVNKATLLPQRGPQGAATGSAAAPAPEAPPRR